ncbi:aldehyde dehydrogenase (NADP(+)) [Pseudomonas sp. MF4836]|uniref:aldehyde dehydrogenase (NADP(+)) n=1 Tax=Pseudomonas sp. MF4836 TaxID=1960827 RepID=UPI0009965CBF|nr:aldehyde dehydrogenase (NADP(+)) [Pseudomonas sp. MF4836]OOW00412.1 aldehyde dehydrogenase [Pseudomonas sp. MF4836]
MSTPELHLIDQAVAQAHQAAAFWAESGRQARAALLDGLAIALEQQQTALIAIAEAETSLGTTRLTGEVARTAFQLRGFADEVRAGVPYMRIDDDAVAGAPPAGRPRLTRVMQALGPVAMFSASNFPFAFSVLGGDTASALAAGCPVVVKAHSGHPRLSRAVYEVAQGVLAEQGLPQGLLGLVEGASRQAGLHLVQHPQIAAVAFTGSYQGGKALWQAANQRPRPIPFFGELGSINPLLALPEILERDGEQLASTLAASITLGCGQFCTSPGVILLLEHPASQRFIESLAQALRPLPTHPMLTEAMRRGFDQGVAHLQQAPAVRPLFEPLADGAGPAPRLFEIQAQAFIEQPELREEVFGPAAVVIRARDVDQARAVLDAIGGTLTATLWGFEQSNEQTRSLLRAARGIAGRVLFSGVPTGVAVTHAQQHGGPWPASTAPQTTSVGYTALERFLRPVALQDAPAWVLEARP